MSYIYIPLEPSMYIVESIDFDGNSTYGLSEYGKKLVSVDHLPENHRLRTLGIETMSSWAKVINHKGNVAIRVRCERSASSYAKGLIRRILKWDHVVTFTGNDVPPTPTTEKYIMLYSFVRKKKTWFVYFSKKSDAIYYTMCNEREGRAYDFSKKSYTHLVPVPETSDGLTIVV